MDKTLRKLITVVLLSAIGVGNVSADPRNQGDDRDRARAERQAEGRRNNDARQQEAAPQNRQQDNQRQPVDNGRRNGRMTQEEKQALRRQINEAGHDIYAPRR